jgi:hypothetical protein
MEVHSPASSCPEKEQRDIYTLEFAFRSKEYNQAGLGCSKWYQESNSYECDVPHRVHKRVF